MNIMNTIKLEELYTTKPGTTGALINNITTGGEHSFTTISNNESTTTNLEVYDGEIQDNLVNIQKIENKMSYN